MTPRLRRFALTAHVTFSVGWLGAVGGFLVLALAGLTSQDAQVVRAAYVAMGLIGWWVLVPCSGAALLTGLIQSLGTEWGLFRHYWIVVKFLLTIGGAVLLLLHMSPTSRLAAVATGRALSAIDLRGLRVQLVADTGAALLVLLTTTALSVYKPWGRIGYERQARSASGKSWGFYVLLGIAALVLLVIVVHLAGGGLHAH